MEGMWDWESMAEREGLHPSDLEKPQNTDVPGVMASDSPPNSAISDCLERILAQILAQMKASNEAPQAMSAR